METILLSTENIRNLIFICLTLLVGIVLDTLLRSLIKVPKKIENRRAGVYITIAHKTISTIIYIIALYLIFNQLGINLTPLLASASILGIIIGIGARALIEDLINGFFILSQDTIALGDYIKVDDAEGVVEKLGFRSLNIRGDSGETYIIPNGLVKKVINYSRHRSYLGVDFPIKSDQKIDLALSSLKTALENLNEEAQFADFIHSGSEVMGIVDYKIEGRIILRIKLVTPLSYKYKAARRLRYLVKKQFEKNKIALC